MRGARSWQLVGFHVSESMISHPYYCLDCVEVVARNKGWYFKQGTSRTGAMPIVRFSDGQTRHARIVGSVSNCVVNDHELLPQAAAQLEAETLRFNLRLMPTRPWPVPANVSCNFCKTPFNTLKTHRMQVTDAAWIELIEHFNSAVHALSTAAGVKRHRACLERLLVAVEEIGTDSGFAPPGSTTKGNIGPHIVDERLRGLIVYQVDRLSGILEHDDADALAFLSLGRTVEQGFAVGFRLGLGEWPRPRTARSATPLTREAVLRGYLEIEPLVGQAEISTARALGRGAVWDIECDLDLVLAADALQISGDDVARDDLRWLIQHTLSAGIWIGHLYAHDRRWPRSGRRARARRGRIAGLDFLGLLVTVGKAADT
jgi:hypothetical protein